jgi:intron-binding protein aquarius
LQAFQRFSNMEQSMFTRFIRLNVPAVQLNKQGRARSSIAQLYNWRYRDLVRPRGPPPPYIRRHA